MKQLIRAFIILTFLFSAISSFAQTRIIKGNIKDENGMPIPYVTVQVKGTTLGTYTDTAGNFILAADSSSKTLRLTFPGFKTTEVAISDNMSIVMKSDALGLSEVVVTAVGI